jgi:hypothetical protein
VTRDRLLEARVVFGSDVAKRLKNPNAIVTLRIRRVDGVVDVVEIPASEAQRFLRGIVW